MVHILCMLISMVFSSFLYAAENEKPLVAVGSFYSKQADQKRPLIAVSHSEGEQWTYVSHLPDGFMYRGEVNSTDCYSNFCIGAGSYYDKSRFLPLVAITSDHGHTWSYVSTQPSDYENHFISPHTTCTHSFCIIVSGYKNTKGNNYPFLTLSRDQGKTWEYPRSIIANLPKDKVSGGFFYEVSCSDNSCVAVGTYSNKQQERHGLIAYSDNQGKEWFYPTLPQELENIETVLKTVKCTNKSCIASGWFFDKNRHKPFILTSRDGGHSWFYSAKELEDSKEIQIYKTNCEDNICIAVGYYKNQDKDFLPLLALSNDNGITWSYPSSVLNVPEKYKAKYNFLETVSCSNNICMAAGVSIGLGSDNLPLLIVSKDRGATWLYLDTILPPDFLDKIEIGTISCKQAYCMATGSYSSQDGKTYPLLGITYDAGTSWTLPSTIISELPKDFEDDGAFLSHTSSQVSKKSEERRRKRERE